MSFEWLIVACWGIVMWSNYVSIVEGTCTSESMNPRPYFHALQYSLRSLLSLVTLLFYIFRLQIPLSTIHIALVSPSLRRTSAPIQFAIVLGVLGTKKTFLFGCRVVWERPSLSYASHGLINLRSSTWGKFATVLQTSTLGGPTTSTRRSLHSRHQW